MSDFKLGKSLCLAKWLNLSLHLDRGKGHSCYHNPEASIPVQDNTKSSSWLHNTSEKMGERSQMIHGDRPSGCEYCWRQENADPGTQQSDRFEKSKSEWAKPYLEKIRSEPLQDINPTYLEVSFSNICQLKCSYCGPHNSSAWMAELKAHGNYTNRKFPVAELKGPEYVQAFWKWWPELKKDLHVFRITGGEPLLAKETWTLIDNLIDFPEPKLEFIINSNLSFERHMIDKLSEKITQLYQANAVKKIKIITSLEAIGAAGEYLRNGINLKFFWSNVAQLLNTHTDLGFSITSTVQALSVDSFAEFLEFFLSFREQNGFENRLEIDPTALVSPEFLRVENMPELEKEYFKKKLKQIREDRTNVLSKNECRSIDNILRLLDLKKSDQEISNARNQVREYFRAYDAVRGLDFLKAFPNLKNYWLQQE